MAESASTLEAARAFGGRVLDRLLDPLAEDPAGHGARDRFAALTGDVLRRLRDPFMGHIEPEPVKRLRALFAEHPEVFTGDVAPSPAIGPWLRTQDAAQLRQLARDAIASMQWFDDTVAPKVGANVSTYVTYLGAGLAGSLDGLTGSSVASALATGIAAITALGSEELDVREGARALGRGAGAGLIYRHVRDAVQRPQRPSPSESE